MILTITIPTELEPTLSSAYNYQEEITDETGELIPNPESLKDFLGRQIIANANAKVSNYAKIVALQSLQAPDVSITIE